MEPSPQSLDAAVLVEQVAPLRRLARRLVWQDADADDLVQDAALAALQSGARAQQPVAWLRGVVRLLALKRASTTARHDRLDRTIRGQEAAPGPQQVMETLELQRRLATVLMDLGEPYRTAIHMRYFQDRPPREIASALGIPVHTVKTHLSRGLERLRVRLDADHGGSRRAWQVALAPLAGIRPDAAAAAATTVGGLTTSSALTMWVVVAAVLVLTAAGSWLLLAGSTLPPEESDGQTTVAADTHDLPSTAETTRLRGRAPGQGAERVDPHGQDARPAPSSEGAAEEAPAGAQDGSPVTTTVHVAVVTEVRDAAGLPRANAEVEVHVNPYVGRRAPARLAHGVSDARGVARLEVPMDTAVPASCEVVVTARDGDLLSSAREITLQVDATPRVVLPLQEALALTIRVEDEGGQPVAGAACTACYASMVAFRSPSGATLSGHTDETGSVLLPIPDRGAEGRFALSGSAGFRIRVQSPGFVDAWSNPIRATDSREHAVTIQAAPARQIAVRVLSEDDEPLAKHSFQLILRRAEPGDDRQVGPTGTVHTDTAGAFRLERAPRGPLVLELRNSGFERAVSRIEEGDTSLTIRLHRRFRATFHVVDAKTKAPLTPELATVSTRPGGRYVPSAVERTAPGRIDLSKLTAGAYTLSIYVEGHWGVHRHPFVMEAKGRAAETVRIPAPDGRRVDVLVRTTAGAPIAEALCHLGLAKTIKPAHERPFVGASRVRMRTDAAGRARVLGLPAGQYALHTRCPDGRTLVTPVPIDEPGGKPIPVEVRIEEGAVLELPTPEAYTSAGLVFGPQVVASDGTRHFPTAPRTAERPGLGMSALPAGPTMVIAETGDFETHPFASDPYAVTLELAPGVTSIPTWPALHAVRAKLVVRDTDGSPLGGVWFALLRVGPDVGPETVRRHRYLSRKRFLLGDDGIHIAHGLFPGRYYLVVTGKGFRMHPFEVADASDQTIHIPR